MESVHSYRAGIESVRAWRETTDESDQRHRRKIEQREDSELTSIHKSRSHEHCSGTRCTSAHLGEEQSPGHRPAQQSPDSAYHRESASVTAR